MKCLVDRNNMLTHVFTSLVSLMIKMTFVLATFLIMFTI